MMENPFSPVFGGRPDCFFGRTSILNRFTAAMTDYGSADRTLFITGTRGYGKTALLEQFSKIAQESGRKSIDVGPENPLGTIWRHIASYDEESRTINPHMKVNVLGTGASVSGVSKTKSIHFTREDFEFLFLKFCEEKHPKLLITIDEVQKVALEDLALICSTFQMISRKGYDVMLALAGLPASYDRIIQHDGCTFMRRAAHVELGAFTRQETEDAFSEAFRPLKQLTLSNDALRELVEFSKGHPYLIQLLGFYLFQNLVNNTLQKGRSKVHKVTKEECHQVFPFVLNTYNNRALAPLTQTLSAGDTVYATAMAFSLNNERLAFTSSIAKYLGRSNSSLSSNRQSLIKQGIIFSPSRGTLAFMIPYLAEFLIAPSEKPSEVEDVALAWRM